MLSLLLCVIPHLQGDITDENFVQSVVEKVAPNFAASFISPPPFQSRPDFVFHLAAQVCM